MNFTLHQLQIFLKVVKTKSITRASEELFLTQPAVSIQLKNFQDQFEIPLTEVIGRQLYITDFGNEIAKVAEKMVLELEEIQYKAQAHKGILAGKLKISVVSTGKYVMPYFLGEFLQQHQGIDLQMDVTNKSRVIQSLENNEVDFALVSVLPDHLPISHEPILENKLFLMGNKPIKTDKHYPKSILNEIPLIYREEGSGTRLVMETFFDRNQISTKKKLELTSNEAVKQALIAGFGLSIMPLIGVHNELTLQQLHIIPVKGLPISSEWSIIWLKNKKLSPLANAYLQFLKKEKEKIRKRYFSWTEKY